MLFIFFSGACFFCWQMESTEENAAVPRTTLEVEGPNLYDWDTLWLEFTNATEQEQRRLFYRMQKKVRI